MDHTEIKAWVDVAEHGFSNGVALPENLAIPAQIAEDMDAANWKAGSGLSNTEGRRAEFRRRRAAAEAAAA